MPLTALYTFKTNQQQIEAAKAATFLVLSKYKECLYAVIKSICFESDIT